MTDSEKSASFLQRLGSVFAAGTVVNEDLLDELEEFLFTADLGVKVTDSITTDIREHYLGKKIDSSETFYALIKEHMIKALGESERAVRVADNGPTVMLFVGVNGTGKTTSIGKISKMLVGQGKKVLMGAGDTFRAAAVEQLTMWADRVGADIVSSLEGGDPAAVMYDAVEAGVARKVDYILLDTAGRLHTKQDLMKQLEKIDRVIKKKIPDAPHEVIMVLDATAGQNGLAQAKQFYQDTGVTGIVLAKMDGTAKGGIVFAIQKELNIPVKFIGVGEGEDDIRPFEKKDFVDRIFFDDLAAPEDGIISKSLENKMSMKQGKQKKSYMRAAILFFIMLVLGGLLAFTLIYPDKWLSIISDLIEKCGC